MPLLRITEYNAQGDVLVNQQITLNSFGVAGNQLSAPFNPFTAQLLLQPDVPCLIIFGNEPTATSNGAPITGPTNLTPGGRRLAVY